jgi:hypothetical protein
MDSDHHGRPGTAPDDGAIRQDHKKSRVKGSGDQAAAEDTITSPSTPTQRKQKVIDFAKLALSHSDSNINPILATIFASLPDVLSPLWSGTAHRQNQQLLLGQRNKTRTRSGQYLPKNIIDSESYQSICCDATLVCDLDRIDDAKMDDLIKMMADQELSTEDPAPTTKVCFTSKANGCLYYNNSSGETVTTIICHHSNCMRAVGWQSRSFAIKGSTGLYCCDYGYRGVHDCQDKEHSNDYLPFLERLTRIILCCLLPPEIKSLVDFLIRDHPSAFYFEPEKTGPRRWLIDFDRINDPSFYHTLQEEVNVLTKISMKRLVALSLGIRHDLPILSDAEEDKYRRVVIREKKELGCQFRINNYNDLKIERKKLCRENGCTTLAFEGKTFCQLHQETTRGLQERKKKTTGEERKKRKKKEKEQKKPHVNLSLRHKHLVSERHRQIASEFTSHEFNVKAADNKLKSIMTIADADVRNELLAAYYDRAGVQRNNESDDAMVLQSVIEGVVRPEHVLPNWATGWNALLHDIVTDVDNGYAELFELTSSEDMPDYEQIKLEGNLSDHVIKIRNASVFYSEVVPNLFGLADKYSFTQTYRNQVGFSIFEDRRNDVLFMCRKSLTGNAESILDKKAYSDMKKQLEELEDLLISTDEELQRSKAELADLQLAKDSCGDNTNNVSPSAPSAGDRLHAEDVIRRLQKKHKEELQTAKDEITRLQALVAASKLQSNDKVPLDNDGHPPAVHAHGGGSGSEGKASLPTSASKNEATSWAGVVSSSKSNGHSGSADAVVAREPRFEPPPARHPSGRGSMLQDRDGNANTAHAHENSRFVPYPRDSSRGITPLARGQMRDDSGVQRRGSHDGPTGAPNMQRSASGGGARYIPRQGGPGGRGEWQGQRNGGRGGGGARYIPRQGGPGGRGEWQGQRNGGRGGGGARYIPRQGGPGGRGEWQGQRNGGRGSMRDEGRGSRRGGTIATYKPDGQPPFGYIMVDGRDYRRKEDGVKFFPTNGFMLQARSLDIYRERVTFKLVNPHGQREFADDVRFA